MSSDVIIAVEGLGKCFPIYDHPRDRLKQFALPPLQKVTGVSVAQYYREFWALRDASFTITKGETVGIIGRNGSGKSTLLQLICGTLSPTSGSVATTGRIAALLELGSGFNPEFSGRENVYLNAAVFGLSRQQIDERFDQIVAFADIGNFIEHPVKTYSSGMVMRLAFAVIAHVDAEILVVDEALSVGDAVFVQKCNRFLREFLNRGTLIFVSHSMHSVLELCDRAIWLSGGHIRLDDEAKEVVRQYNAFVHQESNSNTPIHVERKAAPAVPHKSPETRRSASTRLRNQAKVFAFDPNTPYWGAGGAEVVGIEVLDLDGRAASTMDCGAPVTIRVHCRSTQQLLHPIVGFSLRNQRGVELISENTKNAGVQSPPSILPGESFSAVFSFFLPYLPVGDYFLGGAIADFRDGTAHLQHHRRDDALRISVLCSHVVYGSFSMPMQECTITLI
jgi:lipopolysaccharide transport system ATP-binding protein